MQAVELYKVGHHGSLNATPKSLWELFDNRLRDEDAPERMHSLLSTMAGKHGSEARRTEVPRRSLAAALARESHLFSTEDIADETLFHDTELKL